MKFKCNSSGGVYDFDAPHDIKVMLANLDYTVVVEAPQAPVELTTLAPDEPVLPAPDKPLPVKPVATKAP